MTAAERVLAAEYKGLKDERDRIGVPPIDPEKEPHIEALQERMSEVATEYNGGADGTPPPPPDDDF